MGWTQQEIGDKVDLSQNRISEIIENSDFAKIDKDFHDGKKVHKIAEYYGLDTVVISSTDFFFWKN